MDQLQQLFSAVKHLEETNQELRQELRSVKEELLRRDHNSTELQQELRSMWKELLKREQHSQILETQLEDIRKISNQIQTMKKTADVITSHTTLNPETSQVTRTQRRDAEKRQSSTPTTTPPTRTEREQRRKDSIVGLCDSNRNHLNQRNLFEGG